MREKTVEAKLVAAVKAMGGLSPKFISPGYDGMPDRLVLLPNGILAFVELKAPGKKLRPLQVRRKAQLEGLGFSVYLNRFSRLRRDRRLCMGIKNAAFSYFEKAAYLSDIT